MDSKVSQMQPKTTLTGNELVMVVVPGVGNYHVVLSDLVAGLSQVAVTAEQLGLGSVDNTRDLDKPVSTAAQELFDAITLALNNKAGTAHSHDISDVTDLAVTLENLTTALASKLSASDISTLETTVTTLAQNLANKADTSHNHTIADVTDLQTTLDALATANTTQDQAIASKADSTAVTQALADKANAAHDHVANDITDLAAFLATLIKPQFGVVTANITANSSDLQVTFTTSNGYSMSNVAVKARYKLSTDSVWTDAVEQLFTGGQLSYTFNLSSLVALSNYDFEVYLSDANNPSLDVLVAGVFATLS